MTSSPTATGPQRRFLDALAAGRLELPVCSACGACHFPPAAICPTCGGTAFGWQPASGRGVVHAATVVRRKAAEGGDHGVCLIDLDEGVRLMASVDGMAPQDVTIGLPVVARVGPDATGAMRLAFAPAGTPDHG